MKHIIFDIGNVLLAFQPQAFLQKHFAPSVVDDLMAMVFGSAEWEALDMGTMMTNDAILALANKHPRCRDEIAFVLENWTHMLTARAECCHRTRIKAQRVCAVSPIQFP